MRPHRLAISGLRSYRRRVEIDFSNIGLMAIVGDTGVGKSSILEAITYALYNGTTWNQRDVRTLIADGSQTMSVELDFTADGRLYRVMRSTSRGSYPRPVHRLECLSDSSIAALDNEDVVNAEIERLLGMDWKGFLAAVLLPQGRFQNLLNAGAADRAKILKGIFRLDEIEQVREIADNGGREARPLLTALIQRRGLFRHDPADDAERAAAEAEAAEKEVAALEKIQGDVKDHLDAASKSREQSRLTKDPLERLRKAPQGAAGELEAAVPVASEIDAGLRALRGELTAMREVEQGYRSTLEEAEKAGQGLQILRESVKLVERVEQTLATTRDRRKELEEEAATIEGEAAEVRALEEAVPGLADADSKAASDLSAAEERRNAAVEEWKTARDLLRQVRLASDQLNQQQLGLAERNQALETKKRVELKAAERDAKAKSDGYKKVAHQLEHAVRANAVSVVAGGLAAGDPCPVCARELPPGFVAPAAPDESALRVVVSEAEQALKNAEAAKTTIATEIDRETRALAGEADRLRAAEGELLTKREELMSLLPKFELPLSDEANLQPLVDRGLLLKQEVEASRALATAANSDLVRIKTEASTRRLGLDQRQRELGRKADDNDSAERRAQEELNKLPAAYRPKGGKTPDDLATIKERLTRRLAELEAVAGTLETQSRAIRTTEAQERLLGERWQTEVESVRQRSLRDSDSLRARLNDCLHLTGEDDHTAADETAPLEDLVLWAQGLEGRAASTIARLDENLTALELKASGEEGEAAALLRKFEYRSLTEVDQAMINGRARVLSARNEEKAARAEVAPAEELDRRIGAGTAFVAELEELGRLLTDGQFIGHVIQRRQINLLAIASEILMSMTGNRYGFSADFQVADQVSGQPRPTRTLSGGESFLASLALALGLVEMAARAGGKLDALFLDEGFGALDSNALDEAMAALERRASGGQLVAIVSHLRAIAERIETVLRVSRSPLGSEAVFVKGNERKEYLEDEVEAGLLT